MARPEGGGGGGLTVLRWLRNRGFVFTEDQAHARWDDLGGPTPFEKWRHASLLRYLAVDVALLVIVIVLTLLPPLRLDWWQPSLGGLVGMALGVPFGQKRYNRWHQRLQRWRR